MTEQEQNCIFCKIIKSEIPSFKIYEDDKFFCFLDINPLSKGHSLLIPKEHHVWMNETPDELVAETFIMTKRIMNMMIKEIPCDFVQIQIIGKDVPHFHIHIIPRNMSDDLSKRQIVEYIDGEQDAIISKIKNAL